MNETRVKELLSNEDYVKSLISLGSYEAASDKLAADGIDMSAEELKKAVSLAVKKYNGELSDEELEEVAGGLGPGMVALIYSVGIFAIAGVVRAATSGC